MSMKMDRRYIQLMKKRMVSIAVLTFKEGIRDRALYGITIMAAMMLLATILFTHLFGHELGKVMVDLCLSTIVFAGLLLTFFVNINLMAKDIDRLTIYSVLSKPISRTEYVIGKYFGLVFIVFVSLSLLALFSTGIIHIIKGVESSFFFKDFSWVCYFQAFSYILMMFLLLNAIVIFFSTITTSSFLTLIFSLSVYVTGHSIKTFASHGSLVSLGHTLSVYGYSLTYSMFLLFFAAVIFNKRELK